MAPASLLHDREVHLGVLTESTHGDARGHPLERASEVGSEEGQLAGVDGGRQRELGNPVSGRGRGSLTARGGLPGRLPAPIPRGAVSRAPARDRRSPRSPRSPSSAARRGRGAAKRAIRTARSTTRLALRRGFSSRARSSSEASRDPSSARSRRTTSRGGLWKAVSSVSSHATREVVRNGDPEIAQCREHPGEELVVPGDERRRRGAAGENLGHRAVPVLDRELAGPAQLLVPVEPETPGLPPKCREPHTAPSLGPSSPRSARSGCDRSTRSPIASASPVAWSESTQSARGRDLAIEQDDGLEPPEPLPSPPASSSATRSRGRRGAAAGARPSAPPRAPGRSTSSRP